ncbi:MAG: GMC family oxidoreductase [Sandaracinaceae bacterium]|jgi:choline dehydrogenase-like flavoprotein|nr:GMC family oxidoreductase [Sandaracinaceae bacterium]
MTHVAYREDSASFELDVDYVVVGSGAGGATAAVTLARAGMNVAVVEAGPWRDPDDYPSSTYGAMRDLFDSWGALITRGRAMWPVAQGRVVGGSTVINSAIRVRTPEDIFDMWQRDFGVGGPEMSRELDRIQTEIEGELHAAVVPEVARGNSNKLAMLGAERVGYDSHFMTRYIHDCVGSGQCLQGCKAKRKQSTNVNYIPEVMTRGGTIVSCAPVETIAFEGKKAIGVRGRFEHPQSHKKGSRFFVRAKKGVIVAASATHSPALLLRSGVRTPAVGKFFRAHPGTGLFGVFNEFVDQNIGATQGWASTAYRVEPGIKLETLAIPPELIASRIAGAGSVLMERLQQMRHLAMWVVAVRAETTGTVTNGWTNKPVVHYELNRADMERLRAGLVLVAKTHFAAGAREIITGIHGFPFSIRPDEVNLLENAPLDPRRYVALLSHLFGGAVMGKDPRISVCDDRGRVYEHENLFIADASALPSTLGVNPQHTIMALARYFAERMV